MSKIALTKEMFFDGMDNLLICFPNWAVKFEDEKVSKLWYEMLQDTPDWVFDGGIKQYIKNSKAFPTIAALREECFEYYKNNKQYHEE